MDRAQGFGSRMSRREKEWSFCERTYEWAFYVKRCHSCKNNEIMIVMIEKCVRDDVYM